ncbi:MAG: rhomboid family intramembrane serine protease [Natrialbaceae archaeon]|nr:rhomboid family intramembrane serine protease [Natrialbaceae archaeon]
MSCGIRRRPATVALSLFFLLWYCLQLAVASHYGESTATYLFVATKPDTWPFRQIWPGLLLGPISHSLETVTHVIGNVALLAILGAAIEPTIGRTRLVTLVVGMSYASTALAHLTAPLFQSWATVGVSGGVFALMAYSGCVLWADGHVGLDEPLRSRAGLEAYFATVLVLAVPGVFLYDLVLTHNAGHVFGIFLGVLSYRVDPP